MPSTIPKDPDARRAYRRELRNVARLLRWSGIAFVFVGAVGVGLGHHREWFVAPSWVSFVLGWVLVLSGVVRRERLDEVTGSDPPPV